MLARSYRGRASLQSGALAIAPAPCSSAACERQGSGNRSAHPPACRSGNSRAVLCRKRANRRHSKEVHTGSRYGVFPDGDRMSVGGHSRHYDGAPMTFGLPRQTDILRVQRHFLKVLKVHRLLPPSLAMRADQATIHLPGAAVHAFVIIRPTTGVGTSAHTI